MINFIDINKDKTEILFTDSAYKKSFHISPFRPEMFGSLLYATVYYLCNKYNIELVMHGEANMLPMHSLYCDKSIVYDANKLYRTSKRNFNKNREVLIEHIQREYNNILSSDRVAFCSRFSMNPQYAENKILGMILSIIQNETGEKPQQIMSKVSYSDVKNFILNIFKTRKIYLTKQSEKCFDTIINNQTGRLWFCSHHKPHFMDFEQYVLNKAKELVIKGSLWSQHQSIQESILDLDANSLLSTQILSSVRDDIRFIASGGAATLFQVMPHIRTVHLSIWDYYTLDYDDIKVNSLQELGLSHRIFHVGGILNNSQKIPFKNEIKPLQEMPIPSYARRLKEYDRNILNYIGHVGECLVQQQEAEFLEIINRL